jgi:hypothetical protein
MNDPRAKAKASGKDRLRWYFYSLFVLYALHLLHFLLAGHGSKPEAQVVRAYYAANGVFLLVGWSWLVRMPISAWNRLVLPTWEWVFPKKVGVRGAAIRWISGQPIADDDPELAAVIRNAAVYAGVFIGVLFFLLLPSERTLFELSPGDVREYSLLRRAWASLGWESVVSFDGELVQTGGRVFLVAGICAVMADFVLLFFTMSDTGRRFFKPRLLALREVQSVLEPLPPCPFNPHSEDFELSWFTVMREGKEEWFVSGEKANFTSHIVFGEPGSGKTQGFILPYMRQSIFWQADNPDLKAAGLVLDPKAELSPKAIAMLKEAGREKDIIHLRIGGDTEINPILVKDPLRGTNLDLGVSYVMAAWITSQGASSSEPYWTQTARTLISIAYMLSVCENHGWTGLFSLCSLAMDLAEGLRTTTGGLERRVTVNRRFAERWYGIQLAIDPTVDLETIVPYLPADEQGDADLFLQRIVERAQHFAAYLDTMPEEERTDIATYVARNLGTYTSLYEKIPVENRNQALSNIIPFFRSFINPLVERAVCGRSEFVLDDLLERDGKWIILDIPEHFGPQLVRDITVLIKYRFAKTVLALGAKKGAVGEKPRVKVMIMEEAHKVLTLGHSNVAVTGDAEFFDLCRSSRCTALLVMQGVDSAYNSLGNKEAVNAILTNVISQYGISVKAANTRQYLLDRFMKVVRSRQQRSIGESQAGVSFDARQDDFASSSDSLSITRSESEALEDRFGAEAFTESEDYRAVGMVYDKTIRRQFVGEMCLKPAFWPHPRDSYALMAKADFKPHLRERAIADLTASSKTRASARVLSFLGADPGTKAQA